MTCSQCCGIEKQFDDKVARRELRKFRRKGPRKTTSQLIQFVTGLVENRSSLLDIGGGVGAIQHLMAEEGTRRFVSVDASPAYVAASRSEAERRGYADQVTYIEGDFVERAGTVPESDVVTLDRVICCYPDVESLLGAAADKARSAVGLVFPREDTYVRFGVRLGNWALRLFKSDFQAFVHPHVEVERILADRGFARRSTERTVLWTIALYSRNGRSQE